MRPQTALQLAQIQGAIQITEQVLKVQLDFATKLQQQLENLQQQRDRLTNEIE